MVDPLAYFQKRVPGLARDGNDYRAKCPLHQGTTDTSFALDPKTWRWFCHGACECGGDAIALEEKIFNIPFKAAKRQVEEVMGTASDEPIQIASARQAKERTPLGPIVATYDYHDAAGVLSYQVVRYDWPKKDFRQRRPNGKGGWNWSIKGLPPLLYHQPEVTATPGVVYLTEGEKDADALRDAFGVNATCNSGGAGKFKPELAPLLAGRQVVIFEDPDAAGREHVVDVGTLLLLQGCEVKIARMPGAKDPAEWIAKGGTRDALVQLLKDTPKWAGPHRVLEEPSDELPDAVPTLLPANLREMLATYVVIVGTEGIYDRRTGRTMSQGALKLAHGDDAKGWLKEPLRLRVDAEKLVFAPEGARPGELNLFTGLPRLVVRDRSSVVPWWEHSDLMAGRDTDLVHWVRCRLAYKIQNPGAKIASSLVIHGAPGTGKNLFFAPLLAIFGRYGEVIGQQQIESPYTDWLSGKLLLVADEVASRGERYAVKNKLKALITSESLAINEKFASCRWERNCADIHFLSNDLVPLVVEPGDRRFCVIRFDLVQAPAYYEALAAVDPGALYEALMEWDCGDFNAHTKPPDTRAKRELLELTQEPTDRFLDAWLAGDLPVPFNTGAIKADLYKAYDVWSKASGERKVVQSSVEFGRLVAARLGDHNFRVGGIMTRSWSVGTERPDEYELGEFQKALAAWVKREQEARL